jgi:hypothetical protein
MKKIISTVILAITALALLAAPARAETNPVTEFLSDLSDAGFKVTSSNQSDYIIVGLGVCVDLLSGTPMSVELEGVMEHGGLSRSEATNLIKAAVVDLCPAAAETTRA